MKSVNLNFLEPSGPLQACNGTALTFFLKIYPENISCFEIEQNNCHTDEALHTLLQRWSKFTLITIDSYRKGKKVIWVIGVICVIGVIGVMEVMG